MPSTHLLLEMVDALGSILACHLAWRELPEGIVELKGRAEKRIMLSETAEPLFLGRV